MLRSTLTNWREYLTPISHESTFDTTGQITPEEFVSAGNYLCHMFPTWKWNNIEKNILNRDFLPKENQFLVTRKVPCKIRVAQYAEVSNSDTKETISEDDWVIESKNTMIDPQMLNSDEKDIDEILKGMEITDEEYLDRDDDVLAIIPNNIRYYDLYITYSTSYRVPKLYLVGFNCEGSPLLPDQMFEDISPDYKTKTATIEKLPFYKNSITSVSIHPCKHANVMKVLMDKISLVKSKENTNQLNTSNDEWEDIQNDLDIRMRVDQYLVVFLKFITSVTPGIEHDYTMESW